MHTNKNTPWEWRELTWPDALSPGQAHDTLEHLASSASLGPLVLELRATKSGLRWLLAAQPARVQEVLSTLSSHLSLRAHTPRRARPDVEHAAALRIVGNDLSLENTRVSAAVRGLYGEYSAV